MPRVILITFDSRGVELSPSIGRILSQSRLLDVIDEVKVFGPPDLGQEFWEKHSELVLSSPRGFGLWSWKPFLIKRELSLLEEGDILIYLDAGVEINRRGLPRLNHYLDFAVRNDAVIFRQALLHGNWTKWHPKLLSEENFFRSQVVAGILILKNCSRTRMLISTWSEFCEFNGGELLLDPIPGSTEYHENLIHHRHDQAVLSKAVFDMEFETLEDETMFKPWSGGKTFPFLALRNTKSRFSWIPWVFWVPFRIWHLVYVLKNPYLISETKQKLLASWRQGSRKLAESFRVRK